MQILEVIMPNQKRKSWLPREGYYVIIDGKKKFISTGVNTNSEERRRYNENKMGQSRSKR